MNPQSAFRNLHFLQGVPMKIKICVIISILLVFLILAGCATQTQLPNLLPKVPGFWHGLWHGFIAPLSMIGSIFMKIRIYAFPNSGFWYDLGFMLGIGGFSGGIFGAMRSRKRHSKTRD
jgi:hypothetical protein